MSRPKPRGSRSGGKSDGSAGDSDRQALELIRQGRLQEAERIYRTRLAAGEISDQILCNLAYICATEQRWQEAIALCERTLAIRPDHPQATTNLAAAHLNSGNRDEAIRLLRHALHLQPTEASAHLNLGRALEESGALAEALALYRHALSLSPGDPQTQRLIGACLTRLGRHTEALQTLTDLLSRHRADPLIHAALGVCHYESGAVSEAIAAYRESLRSDPADASCHSNLAVALVETGEIAAAIHHFEQAISLEPGNGEHRYNASMAYLYRPEDYRRGWQFYEWRSRRTRHAILPDASPSGEVWDGGPLTAGDTLLVVSEQGYGDTLQFMRYVHVVRQRHQADVRVCAPAKLHGLIRSSGICAEPLTPEQAQTSPMRWIPMMSLPGRLGVTPANVLWSRPYIRPAAALTQRWRDLLRLEGGPVVAIHWQGNPDHERAVTRGRSLPLEAFAPLAAIDGIRFLSLQKGHGSEQLADCSFRERFVSCQDQVDATWDFEETAAIIAACDLLISNDTAVIHLAGGMGRPAWLLLKQVPEWRWGLEGESSFWYTSLRLFRQRQRGDWAELIERVAAALARWQPGRAPSAEARTMVPEPPARTETAARPSEALAAVAPAASAPARPPSGLRVATEGPPEEVSTAAPATARESGDQILAPVSVGELIDKITILELKLRHLSGQARRNVARELRALNHTLAGLELRIDPELLADLRQVNARLWTIEDAIRAKERQQDFGDAFIALARSVYRENDLRAALKRRINQSCGSALQEEKSYQAY